MLAPGHAAPLGDCLAAQITSGTTDALGSGPARMLRRAVLYRSHAAAPLTLHRGTAIGALCAISRGENAFDTSDELVLAVYARLLSASAQLEVVGEGIAGLSRVFSPGEPGRRFAPMSLEELAGP